MNLNFKICLFFSFYYLNQNQYLDQRLFILKHVLIVILFIRIRIDPKIIPFWSFLISKAFQIWTYQMWLIKTYYNITNERRLKKRQVLRFEKEVFSASI